MSNSVQQFLREAKWFWGAVAILILVSSWTRIFIKPFGKNLILCKVNGLELDVERLQEKLFQEEKVREMFRMWGMKLNPITQEEAFKMCQSDLVKQSVALNCGLQVSDEAVSKKIRSQLPKDIINSFESKGPEEYQSLVKGMGYTSVLRFEQAQREAELAELGKDITSLAINANVTKHPKADKSRKVEILELFLRDFFNSPEKIREDIENFYQLNKDKYKDKGALELLVAKIDKKKLEESVVVSDEEISHYYARNKTKKFYTPKTYTFNVWTMTFNQQEQADTEVGSELSRIQELVQKCQSDKIVQKSEKCKDAAKKFGIELEVQSYKGKTLESSNLPSAVQKALRTFEAEAGQTTPVQDGKKWFMVDLLSKAAAQTKDLVAVTPEIKKTIANKKAENLVSKMTSDLSKSLRTLYQKKIGATQAQKTLEGQNDDSNVSFEVLRIDQSSTKLSNKELESLVNKEKLLEKVDSLEMGKVGTTSDSDSALVYLVSKITKRQVLDLETVLQEVKQDLARSNAQANIKARAKEIKQRLLNNQGWPGELEKEVKVKKVSDLVLPDPIKAGIKKLFNLKQVFAQQDDKNDKFYIAKLVDSENNKDVTTDDQELGVEEVSSEALTSLILDKMLANAQIEDFAPKNK